MGMLNKPQMKENNKIGRGSKIEVKNKVGINDIHELKNNINEISESVLPRVTIPINIRVDNHDRNAIASLVTMGRFQTNKEFVEWAIEEYVSQLSDDELKRFNYIKDTYEIKDYEKDKRKNS